MVSRKTLSGSVRFLARLGVLALVAVVATLGFAQDTPRVEATHTQVIFTLSPGATTPITAVVLAVHCNVWDTLDCTEAGTPPSRTLYARAQNVHDPTGLGGFNVKVEYDGDLVTATNIAWSSAWLDDSGRTPFCSDPEDPPAIQPIPDSDNQWRGTVSCATIGQEPPGVQGSGLIGSLTLQAATGATPANTLLDNESILVNTTSEPETLVIPAVLQEPSLLIAYCADVSGGPGGAPDGVVTGLDISAVVARFGATPSSGNWHPKYDLNADDAVVGQDISLTVLQFGLFC